MEPPSILGSAREDWGAVHSVRFGRNQLLGGQCVSRAGGVEDFTVGHIGWSVDY